jgi:hypothetical protein
VTGVANTLARSRSVRGATTTKATTTTTTTPLTNKKEEESHPFIIDFRRQKKNCVYPLLFLFSPVFVLLYKASSLAEYS